MKKIIKLSLLFFILSLSSCSSPLNKSVIEPIEIKDLKNIIEKDTLFEFTYKAIEKIRNAKLIDDVEKAKWSDMTYYRVHKIIQLYSDTLAQSEYTEKIKSDWNEKYGVFLSKADSISDYWKNYKKERSLTNFVSIELFDVETKNNGSSYVGFKITPLEGDIDKVFFQYVFTKKSDKDKISEREKFSILNERNVIIHIKERITKSKIFWELDYKNGDILKDKILEEVLHKYAFDLQLNSITKNGVRLSKYDIKIPYSVESMWETDYGDNMFEYYRNDVIKEFINDEFVGYSNFKSLKIDSIAKTIDPKVIEFLELSVEK